MNVSCGISFEDVGRTLSLHMGWAAHDPQELKVKLTLFHDGPECAARTYSNTFTSENLCECLDFSFVDESYPKHLAKELVLRNFFSDMLSPDIENLKFLQNESSEYRINFVFSYDAANLRIPEDTPVPGNINWNLATSGVIKLPLYRHIASTQTGSPLLQPRDEK